MGRRKAKKSDDKDDAGSSLDRTYESRMRKHEAGIEEKWGTGLIGKTAKILAEEPQHAKAFRTGAEGERRVAATIKKRIKRDHLALHNRTYPNKKGDIDHIVITTSGVWVIDSKKYGGKIEVKRPMFDDERLMIKGRNQTKLVAGVRKQCEAVKAALAEHGLRRVPVHGLLCFVDGEFALPGTDVIDGISICGPKGMARTVNKDKGAGIDLSVVAAALDAAFPPA